MGGVEGESDVEPTLAVAEDCDDHAKFHEILAGLCLALVDHVDNAHNDENHRHGYHGVEVDYETPFSTAVELRVSS